MGFIKNFNVVKLDRKGRIILPFHVRDYMGLKEGMEILISNNEKNELKIFPLFTGKILDLKLMLEDKLGIERLPCPERPTRECEDRTRAVALKDTGRAGRRRGGRHDRAAPTGARFSLFRGREREGENDEQ